MASFSASKLASSASSKCPFLANSTGVNMNFHTTILPALMTRFSSSCPFLSKIPLSRNIHTRIEENRSIEQDLVTCPITGVKGQMSFCPGAKLAIKQAIDIARTKQDDNSSKDTENDKSQLLGLSINEFPKAVEEMRLNGSNHNGG